MTVDPVTGLVEWLSPIPGSHIICIAVSDGVQTTYHSYGLGIPFTMEVISEPETYGPRYTPYWYRIEVDNPTGRPLSFVLSDNYYGYYSCDVPRGMTVDPVTGLVEWLLPIPSDDRYYICIAISDGVETIYDEYWLYTPFTMEVTSEPVERGFPSVPYRYQIEVDNPVGLPLSYALSANSYYSDYCDVPPGMTVDPATGLIEWLSPIPNDDDYNICIAISDGVETIYHDYWLEISSAPVVTSKPATIAPRDVPYRYQIEAYSPTGLPLTYAFYYYSPPTGMTIDPNTGLIEWPSPVLERFGWDRGIGVAISDGVETTYHYYWLTISSAPVVTSEPATTAPRNTPYRYQIEAYSPVGLPLSYAFDYSPPVGMTIDPATGLIEWPSPTLGNYYNRIRVSDGVETTYEDYRPTISSKPVVTSEPVTWGFPNAPYRYQIEAYSPLSLPRTYAFEYPDYIPSGMTVNPATGLIEWLSPALGRYWIRVTISDGVETIYQSYDLTISSAPAIASTPVTEAPRNVPYQYQVEAYSSAGLPLTYAFSYPPPEGMTIDPGTGTINWLLPIVGEYHIGIAVSDAVGTTYQDYWLTISSAPIVTSDSMARGFFNLPYQYQIEAHSPAGLPLSYAFRSRPPSGMTLNPATGLIEWPSPTLGSYGIGIAVSDGVETSYRYYGLTINLPPP
jgi:hypothetical protein